MNTLKEIFLFLLILLSLNSIAQSKFDSLSKKVDQLEKSADKVTSISEKLDQIDSKLDTKTGNILTDNGNILSWISIVLALIVIVFGFQNYSQHKRSEELKKEIKETLVETKKEANLILVDVLKIKTNIENVHNEMNVEKAFIAALKNELESYKLDLINTKTRYERDKLNIPEYSDACEKMEEGITDQALQMFKQILERDPEFYLASAKIPMCYSSLDDNKVAQTLVEITIKNFKKVKANNPNPEIETALYDAYTSEGVILRRLKRYDEAIISLRRNLLNVDSENEMQLKRSTYSHIGYSFLYKRDFEGALKYFSKGMKSDKSSPSYYGSVKATYFRDKTINPIILDDAISISKKDLLDNPKYPYHNFGATFLELINAIIKGNNGDLFKEYLNRALDKCRNLGILNEQLLEYKIMASLINKNELVDFAIDTLEKRISYISKTITDSQEVFNK